MTASGYNYFMSQGYDGDGLRGFKNENSAVTHYLRSTVLGGAVVAEIDSNGGSQRGYVYAGGELMSVHQGGQVYWVHEDAITKSKRTTDVNGNVVSSIELDPWGAGTNRSNNSAFLPKNFTTYIRDANGGQDAMARRYSVGGRFSQPDPYGGSYNFGDPQSLNRYAYTKNDPVNFRDPSGLEMNASFCGAEFSYEQCGGDAGFWGGSRGGGGGFGGDVARYNREYGGMPPNVASALAAYNQRLQNTRDALAANRALQQFVASEGTNHNALQQLLALMAANPTLVLQWVQGPFVFTDVYDHFDKYEQVKPNTKKCATWVQQIAEKLGTPLGLASNWYGGEQVNANTQHGTAIMSGLDANGRYPE